MYTDDFSSFYSILESEIKMALGRKYMTAYFKYFHRQTTILIYLPLVIRTNAPYSKSSLIHPLVSLWFIFYIPADLSIVLNVTFPLSFTFCTTYCWFSHDVTKIQTTKLSILLRFYFHGILEQLKTNFQTNFRFKRVLGFVIEYDWIFKLLRDAAFTWRPRELSFRLKKSHFFRGIWLS